VARGRVYRQGERQELTERERDVCRLLTVEALSVKEAAARLYISHHTVENHRLSAYRKLGVHNRLELLRALAQLQPA
jgi:DNA-binding CsgD family transcriptional regulator